jgi:hypothetical protein
MTKIFISLFTLVFLTYSSALADHKKTPTESPKALVNKPIACQEIDNNDLMDYLDSQHMYPTMGAPGFALANLEGQYKASLYFVFVNDDAEYALIEVSNQQICMIGHGSGMNYDVDKLKSILGMIKENDNGSD